MTPARIFRKCHHYWGLDATKPGPPHLEDETVFIELLLLKGLAALKAAGAGKALVGLVHAGYWKSVAVGAVAAGAGVVVYRSATRLLAAIDAVASGRERSAAEAIRAATDLYHTLHGVENAESYTDVLAEFVEGGWEYVESWQKVYAGAKELKGALARA